MIDTHAHIDAEQFDDDREEMIARAFSNGIEIIIIPAIEPSGYDRILQLTRDFNQIFCSIGIHPHNAHEATDETYKDITGRAISSKKVIAIGEIGLDYYYDFCPPEIQKHVFERQISIAKKLNLPIIVHNRNADEDLLEILNRQQDGSLRGVLHCFSSGIETLERALVLGFNVSFTGNITFKKSNLDEVVLKSPIERIMLETDSPYMTPVPLRGKRNEPANVKFIVEKISEIKSISIDEVINMTTKTAKRFFNLSLIMILFLATSLFSFSQTDNNEQPPKEEVTIHPYKKGFGFGPVLGTNTIVWTRYLQGGAEPSSSFPGISAIGGGLYYGFTDFLTGDFSFVYSKNSSVAKIYPGLIQPDHHRIVGMDLHWIVNPYARVNFYGTTGVSVMLNTYNTVFETKSGLDFGLGFCINLQTSIGLLTLNGEWRLVFILNKTEETYFTSTTPPISYVTVPTSSYYSIPGLKLSLFPKF